MPPSRILGALVVVAAVSIATARLGRRAPYLVAGWWWYVVTLLPVIGLVQVGAQAMADRYTYVPMIGIAAVVAWGAVDLFRRYSNARVWLAAVATTAVVLMAVTAHAQAQYWRNSTVFWTRAATKAFAVTDFQAHLELGRVLAIQGRTAEAYDHYAKAVELRPDSADAHHGLGLAHLALDDGTSAARSLEVAARLQPASAIILNDLGWALLKARRPEEARSRLVEAIRLKSDFAGAHANLGISYAVEGALAQALPSLREALRLDPGLESARINLGRALAGLGRRDEAIRELEEVLRRSPGNGAARELLEKVRTSGR
jgi:Flp pilus assembly protein TadD